MIFLSVENYRFERLCATIASTVLAFLALSAFCPPSYSQQRGKEKPRPAARTVQPKAVSASGPSAARLFDAAFEREILRVSFIDKSTDEIEFTRIYNALADDMTRLREALSVAIVSAEKTYGACLATANTVHRRQKAIALEKMKRNKDPERAESLKSLISSIEREHKNYYRAEAGKAGNSFKSLFDSFAASFAAQRKFLTSNTAYESPDSESMRALDSFEAGIMRKREKIEKYIADKFEAVAGGADHGDK